MHGRGVIENGGAIGSRTIGRRSEIIRQISRQGLHQWFDQLEWQWRTRQWTIVIEEIVWQIVQIISSSCKWRNKY